MHSSNDSLSLTPRQGQSLIFHSTAQFQLYASNFQYQYTERQARVYDFYTDNCVKLYRLLEWRRHLFQLWLTRHLWWIYLFGRTIHFILLVVAAAATNPRWNVFLKCVDMLHCLPPPVTDIIRSGVGKRQARCINSTIVLAFVPRDKRIYWESRVIELDSLLSNFK